MRYKACFFDLYGTLVDIHTDESCPFLWETMAEWYAPHGALYTPEALREAYQAHTEEETESIRQRLSVQYPEPDLGKVFSGLFQDRGVSADDGLVRHTALLFRRTSRSRLRLYAGAEDLLKRLNQAGSGVYLLTNAQRLFTENELEECGIGGLFDGVFISSDYGVKKPDPVFFETALRIAGYDPSECLMVGNDLQCDIEGALSAGMSGYFILSAYSPAAE